MAGIKNYILDFGPQHPAAHDVLRLVLGLDGEITQRTNPHADLLHHATEKLAEQKTWIQSVPYIDHLDYVSMMANKHAYVMAIGRLLGLEMPLHAQYIRVTFGEITWITNHLMWIDSHALDMGAIAVFLYTFREREDLFDIYGAVSGARIHAAYYRPGGVYCGLPGMTLQYKAPKVRSEKALATLDGTRSGLLLDFVEDFTNRFPKYVDEYETLLTDNRIQKQHLVGIGVVSPEYTPNRGFSDMMLRSSGIEWDVYKKQLYEVYGHIDSDIPVGVDGNRYDHYLVRIEEMRQSNRITHRYIKWLCKNPGPVTADNHKMASPSRVNMEINMEELIHHFKLFMEGMHVPESEAYATVEHPKGEFGIYAISDDTNRPYRLKIHTPGLVHLAVLDEMAKSHMIADAVTIVGTQGIVLGEIDH